MRSFVFSSVTLDGLARPSTIPVLTPKLRMFSIEFKGLEENAVTEHAVVILIFA